MKTINILLFAGFLFASNAATSQEEYVEKNHGIPVGSIMVQLSPDNNDDKSSVLGIELQANFPVSESFVLGVHANLQEQTYGDIAPVRASLENTTNEI